MPSYAEPKLLEGTLHGLWDEPKALEKPYPPRVLDLVPKDPSIGESEYGILRLEKDVGISGVVRKPEPRALPDGSPLRSCPLATLPPKALDSGEESPNRPPPREEEGDSEWLELVLI